MAKEPHDSTSGGVERSHQAPFGFYIEQRLRSKSFGVLGTISRDGRPHSVGVVYGVSPPGAPFCLYLVTRPVLKKVRNIAQNPNVLFVVPFPHYFLRPLPQSCIQFQGKARLIPIDDQEAASVSERSIVLRMSKDHSLGLGESVFIRVVPDDEIFSFGISAGAFQFVIQSRSKNLGNFYVAVPQNRLST